MPLAIRTFAALCLLPVCLCAGEVSTGFLIGPRYDARSFYYRKDGGVWEKTYAAPSYRREAQGKLFGLRMTHAGLTSPALSVRLDEWKQAGVLLVSVPLLAAGPEEPQEPAVFRPDGSLEEKGLAVLDAFLGALEQRDMIAKLILFRPERDEIFDSGDAMLTAANLLTDWLISRNHRHVLLSIATDWDRRGWHHDNYVPQNLELLIESVRDRFQAKRAGFALPILVSTGVNLAPNSRLIERGDVLVAHAEGLAIDVRRIERPEIIVAEPGERETPGPEAAMIRASGWLGVMQGPDADPAWLESIRRLTRSPAARPSTGKARGRK